MEEQLHIWVKDYIKKSKFKDINLIYGNLDKKYKPFIKIFKSLDLWEESLVERNFIH